SPTGVVMASMPAYAGALPLLPLGNTGAQGIDDAYHFVSRYPGILNSGPQALFGKRVTVAHATGLHLDPHLSCARLGNPAFDDLKLCSRFMNLCCLHRSDCDCCCHRSSHELATILLHPREMSCAQTHRLRHLVETQVVFHLRMDQLFNPSQECCA